MKLFDNLTNAFMTGVGHTKTFAVKNAPELMIFGGIAAGIGAVVTSYKAGTKADSLASFYEMKEGHCIRMNEQYESDPEQYEEAPYTKEMLDKDLKLLKQKKIFDFLKIAAPTIVLETLSIGLILGSHHIMKQRNVALAASCAAIAKSYQAYRDAVAERFGKDVDDELYYGYKKKEITVDETDPDTGEVKKVKKEVNELVEKYGCSPFARIIDSSSLEWDGDNDSAMFLAQCRGKEANMRLKCARDGILTLNTVYEMLGLTKTAVGMTHGWIYDKNNKDGDNKVIFDIREVYRYNEETGRDEKVVLIDFNCDGYIYDKVEHMLA